MTRERPTWGPAPRSTHRSVPHSPGGVPQVPEIDPLHAAGPELERVRLGPWPLAPDEQHETQAGGGSLLPPRAHLQRGKNGGPAGGGGGRPLYREPSPQRMLLGSASASWDTRRGPGTWVGHSVRLLPTRGPSGLPAGLPISLSAPSPTAATRTAHPAPPF